jgi:hypothetical protein
MTQVEDNLQQQVRRLVDEYRDQCLWFLRADYYPMDRAETLRVLDYIRRHGDLEAFRKAGALYQWLSPRSKEESTA